jgi:hypothetical protein
MRALIVLALSLSAAGCLVNTELYEELSDKLAQGDSGQADDRDGDGWSEDQDCDDGDPSIHPEADELCNGVDDDCDEQVDEDAIDGVAYYLDQDGDGYGGGEGVTACEPPADRVSQDGDCHDDDPTAFPGSEAPELPDDIDQDCDGNPGCTDLDCDGLPDLVIPSERDDDGRASSSPLWFGTGDLLGESPHLALPSQGAVAAVAEDFDRDGWVDVAFIGYYYDKTYTLSGLIYQGAADGFDPDRRLAVSTLSALDATSADLDQDGFPELIVTSGTVDTGDATIFWGSRDGPSDGDSTTLSTSGTWRVLVSDLDGDGWQDLVLISAASSRGAETRSTVYWNRGGGFQNDDFDSLHGFGAVDGICVDLDLDGYQEIVVANKQSDESYEVFTRVHHGDAFGYTDSAVTDLPALGASAVDSADLNQDGWPDLVVAHASSDSSTQIDSMIFWGSEDGVTGAQSTPLPTRAARDVAIADLDRDGWLDVVFANYYGPHGTSTDSTVYWGSVDGFSTSDVSELPTVGATRVMVGDVDQDGWPDLFFGQYTSGTSFEVPSYLYYGSAGGFSVEHRESLHVDGPWGPAILVGGEMAAQGGQP